MNTKLYPLLADGEVAVSTETEEYIDYGRPTVDPERIAEEIMDIKRKLNRVFEEDTEGSFALHSVEVQLAIGVEGGIWFIAKGTAEASLKLVFGRK